MKKVSNNISLKRLIVLCFWGSLIFAAEEHNQEAELKTTFHVYLSHVPAKTNSISFEKEISLEQIRLDEMSWYRNKWMGIGAILGGGISGCLGYGMLTVLATVPSIIDNDWTYTLLFPGVFGLMTGTQLGLMCGSWWESEKIKRISTVVGTLSCGALFPVVAYSFYKYIPTDAENGTVAAGILDIIEFGILGMTSGAYLGANYLGQYVGEKNTQNNINQNSEWIEEPYLDLAFRTTQGSRVIYDLTTRLRPKNKGWKNITYDTEKKYPSSIRVGWLIGECANDDSLESINKNNIYDSLFENDSIEDQKIKIKDMKSSLDVFSDYFFSDSDLHVTHEKLKINEIFKGELPCAYSVGKLIEIITTLTLAQGQLPECSWSGKSKRKNNVINDVLNPGIFTIRLLSRLGVAIQDTVLKRFLTPYCDEAPVIRGLLIGELYENKDILKLSHNEDLITQLFSEYLGAKNPVYTAQVDTSYYSDLELGLKEKERQVKQLIAQKLALRSVSVSTIFNITGIDVTDTSAPPLKPFNSLSSGKNLINGSPDLFSSKPLVAYNSGTLAAEMTYEQFIKDSQVAHDENSIIG